MPKDIQMRLPLLLLLLFSSILFRAQTPSPAADHPNQYLYLLEGKTVAVVANQTSMVGEVHLVDFLVDQNISIKRVFAPEHGFRGAAAAGEHVEDSHDTKTGLPIVSLYGNHKKPLPYEVNDVDVVVFDIQDVGVRFYTYISTMTYVMEACAENGVKMMVLDRPNPNGSLIDGPVLEPQHASFVGLHPIPISHGMTVGEYAQMVVGEAWIDAANELDLTVIPCEDYTHATPYELPVAPSPNLPNQASILLYPSLCLFEGTPVSVGRGTNKPFQQIGAPWFPELGHSFTPQSVPQAPNPKFKNEECLGVDLTSFGESFLPEHQQLYLFWLIEAFRMAPEKEDFFTNYFTLLAGTPDLAQQIREGKSEEEIRASWEPGLLDFKIMREAYLLYD